jgi:prepilin-type N-terminal cleavage/methylation domain-containing protein
MSTNGHKVIFDFRSKSAIGNRKSAIETCSGFTLVELLLAVAIAGMLLGAVAFAFNASAINCRENEEIFKTMNNARQAMFRMTSQLRTADAVDPNAPSNECTLITAAGQDITYRYNSGDKKLYLVTNGDLSDSDYVLCDNVTAMTCTKNSVVEDSLVKVKSVQISITVSSGDMQRTVSAAAVIRRNLK